MIIIDGNGFVRQAGYRNWKNKKQNFDDQFDVGELWHFKDMRSFDFILFLEKKTKLKF